MKIGFTGIELPEGKVKYKDSRMDILVEKHQPKKITPFYVEFIKDEFTKSEAIVIPENHALDLLILDIEKCETRLERCETEEEKILMRKCLEYLEKEVPLCDGDFSASEHEQLKRFAPTSYKPVALADSASSENEIIRQTLIKANIIFFYTAGPKEVHAWPVEKNSDIVTCAGKIHTDLARGFIKGDVVSFDDYTQCHNFNDGKKKGLVKVVERDYIIQDGDIIEIRFGV